MESELNINANCLNKLLNCMENGDNTQLNETECFEQQNWTMIDNVCLDIWIYITNCFLNDDKKHDDMIVEPSESTENINHFVVMERLLN